MRLLRAYCYVAQTAHFCDHCFHQILPGDQYEGEVFVTGDGRLFVLRTHVFPFCPVDPSEEEADLDRLLEQSEPEIESEVLAEAA